jgi:hypothetical protein
MYTNISEFTWRRFMRDERGENGSPVKLSHERKNPHDGRQAHQSKSYRAESGTPTIERASNRNRHAASVSGR